MCIFTVLLEETRYPWEEDSQYTGWEHAPVGAGDRLTHNAISVYHHVCPLRIPEASPQTS